MHLLPRAAALLLSACGTPPPEPPAPTWQDVEPAHVGSDRCAACHAPEAKAWRTSQHRRDALPAPDALVAPFDGATLQAHGTTFTFDRSADGRPQVTTQTDEATTTYVVAHGIGAFPLQQVVVKGEAGALQVPTVAWDARPAADGGQRWFALQPDVPSGPGEALDWTGPAYNANHMCLECHVTGFTKGFDAEPGTYTSTWTEPQVGCEACHGPGAQHVAWADADGPTDASSDGLLDLSGNEPEAWVRAPDAPVAHLNGPPHQAQVDACGRCHARRSTLDDAHPDGAPLANTHRPALLEAHLYLPDGRIDDEVYVWGSFVQSRMHAAGVTCSDCHEPHSGAVLAEGNALCVRCHDAATYDTTQHHHHEEGACVDCHMPERTYMGIDPRRDHSLKAPHPVRDAALGLRSTCTTGCHTDKDAAWAAQAASSWYGDEPHWDDAWIEALAAARGQQEEGAGKLAEALRDDDLPAIIRATLASEVARANTSVSREALSKLLSHPDPMVRLGALRGFESDPSPDKALVLARLLEDPSRPVRLEATRQLLGNTLSRFPTASRDQLLEGLAQLDARISRDADRPEGQLSRGVYETGRGRPELAEAAYREAIRMAPHDAAGWANLADLQRAQGQDAAALATLRRGLEQVPDDASLHHALGLALVRTGDRTDALTHLARAVELAPTDARMAFVYAIARKDLGQPKQAMAALEAAVQRMPGNLDLRYTLATLLEAEGKRAAAHEHAVVLARVEPAVPAFGQLLERTKPQ